MSRKYKWYFADKIPETGLGLYPYIRMSPTENLLQNLNPKCNILPQPR